jgi:hypothetical protein
MAGVRQHKGISMKALRLILALSMSIGVGSCCPCPNTSVASICPQGNSTIQGKVTDCTGASVYGALLEIAGPSLGCLKKTTTDQHGYYSLRSLPPGKYYQLLVTAEGYTKVRHLSIVCRPFTTINIDFMLQDTVITSSETPMIDYSDAGGRTIVEVNE